MVWTQTSSGLSVPGRTWDYIWLFGACTNKHSFHSGTYIYIRGGGVYWHAQARYIMICNSTLPFWPKGGGIKVGVRCELFISCPLVVCECVCVPLQMNV